MAKKEQTETAISEIKKALKTKKVILGSEMTLKGLKQAKIQKIYLASNCPATQKRDITHLSKLSKVEIVELKQPNDELGTLCKKPFAISVISIPKGA